jgi:sigma-B regulation protein RsbU (phosphoserine phosphatase)
MLTRALQSLRQEYRTHRMARFAVWVAAYGVALGVATRASGVPAKLWLLFWVASIPTAFYYLFRLFRLFRQRLLWRLGRRLVITYLFIAVVPIALILLLVALGAFIINGQFAAFLVALRLRNHFDELRQLNRVVAHEAHQNPSPNPRLLLDRLEKFYLAELSEHTGSYPGLEVALRVGGLERAFRLDGRPLSHPVAVPAWLKQEEFAGVVIDGGEMALRAVDRGQTPVGEITVILSQPFTPELMDLVGAGIGPVGVVVPQVGKSAEPTPQTAPGLRLSTLEGNYVPTASVRSKSIQLPPPANGLDFSVLGRSTLDPVVWGGEKEERSAMPVVLYATSRLLTLNRQLFETLGEFSGIYEITFLGVALLFLVLELLALVVGVQLTRSMTTTVDKLYDATERVKAGELSHRINLPPLDQLSALGKAFDGTTASVERLLRESKEKSRLDSEIEIAREVQRQLFPRAVPPVPGLELYGVCRPASAVSGDYYDFLALGGSRIGLALGDVSGKGISAALLMAAIRSALHAQFYNSHSPQGLSDAAPLSAAEVVARLNRQLFDSSPIEKYATFFFAVYDAKTRRLTYTNAGHWPPVVFRRKAVEHLKAGGTCVGLFSPVAYEQAEIQLEPGDLLLAFTDGITEPENSYGEEFGEARLLAVARRALASPPEVMVEEIYRSVTEWTGSLELQDDMTVLVAKAVA